MLRAGLIALLVLTLAGCGSGSRGKVKGKVVAAGEPVTEGSLMFTPDAGSADGRPATGIIQPDGTFVLGTDADGDGAAIGKHTVIYNAPNPVGPDWLGYGPKPVLKYSPFQGFTPKVAEAEVKAGENDLTIELVPPPTPAGQ